MTSPTTPPIGREPKWQIVARNFRNKIQAGALRHGEVLPSTRDLADEWGVSVFTITEAMQALAAEGLIVSKSRSNRVVNFPLDDNRSRVRPEVPRVLLIGGFPGSGKTELGRVLARLTGWPMLDKDTLTRPVVEAALEILGKSPHDRESTDYLDKVRPREYEALMSAALENVDCGNSAILTAPFIREFCDSAWVTRTQALFEARKVLVSFVWIYCDADTMHTYMRGRGAARDSSKLTDWPGWIGSIDVDFRPPMPHFLLNNSASSTPLQSQAQDLVRKIMGGVIE
jgi:predicted kinase